ncbi:proton pump-interactor 1-like [Cucurbita maxima]|uniref:Proton pump-interactor 1-like n=1 Tax=Cucurbita maxima TaxID=3661 RepID=A0A6J1IM70_CUCMA|nr:proton pump-interactor 1-like [Cucurbita maxima]
MGVEVVGFEMVKGPMDSAPVADNYVLKSDENGDLDQLPEKNVPIKFGSHEEEPVKEQADGSSSASNVPKDAADEWPAPKQIHSFYFIRHRPYDDPSIKAKIDLADKEIRKRSQARFQITETLKSKRAERAELITQLKPLRDDNRQYKSIVDEKIKEIEPLNQALGKFRNANNAGRNGGLCSSEEELNAVIQSLQYHIQHESIPLSEEKQILREIKQLEGTREKVIANSAMRAKLQDSMVHKEALQDQVKIIGGDLNGVRKEQQAVRAKIKQLEEALEAIDEDIKTLQDELTSVTEKRGKAHENIQQLRKNSDEGNAQFYQSRSLLNKAKDLAAKKDIQALEELAFTEVEKFMSLWNGDKAFRDDYEKRILASLDIRQMSRDGRIRNPDEKPILAPADPAPRQTEMAAKPNIKRTKEEPKPVPSDPLPAQKVDIEVKQKAGKPVRPLEQEDKAEEEIPSLLKLSKDIPKEPEVDLAKLKEMKRAEEIAKAKLAMERKKKLQEKAAAKASLRAQKEAEKKLKDREKKAKKKVTASGSAMVPDEEPVEAAAVEEESTELENVNESAEAAPVPVKSKIPKETSIRSRGRQRGLDSVPKIIRKRKKSINYWDWAAPAAAVLLVILLVLGYYYYYLL